MSLIDILENGDELFVNYTLKFLSSCPLPPRPKYDGTEKGKLKFIKKVGNTEIKILADPEYGIPSGRDILPILYLIKVALEQKKRTIKFKSLDDYLRTFKIVSNTNSYEEAKRRFRRIYYTTWFYRRIEEDGSEIKFRFNIIRGWHVYFDVEKKSRALFNSYIELTKDFWDIIKEFKIPYDLNTVIKLKQSPAVLNLYLYLVYRTYKSWISGKKVDSIKFFTPNGLKNQLSSGIENDRHFKANLKSWLDQIKEVWKNCPVHMVLERDETRKGRNKSKMYKDEIVIKVESIEQLHVPPDLKVELGKAVREAIGKYSPPCPKCKKPLSLKMGKEVENGARLDNYFRCKKCKENFYYKDYPNLYKG